MSPEPGVIDTNVLAYAVNADATQHDASRALMEAAQHAATTLYVTSQILCEFYSVITSPRRYSRACSSTDARRIVGSLLAMPGIHVLPIPSGTTSLCMELLARRPVTGGAIFDLQIVATMLMNQVTRIYTFNAADFEVFEELTVLRP